MTVLHACLLIAGPIAASPARAAISIPSNTWVLKAAPPQTGLPGFTGTFDPRGWSHLCYDSLNQRMVFWDGYLDASRPYSIYGNALWLYDVAANRLNLETVTNWVRQNGATVPLPANTTTPTPYDRHSYSTIAVAPSLNRLFLWAGANNSVPENPYGDLWIYDFGTKRWHVALPAVRPQTMFEQAMVWDPGIGKVTLFAGPVATWGDGDRAWHFDPTSETWADKSTSPEPSVRMSQVMAYDPSRHGTWMFGGNLWPNGGNELWFYDAAANRWDLITTSGSKPSPRRFAGWAYDSRRDIFILWGGVDGNDVGLNDTWIFRPGIRAWQQLAPANPPPAGTYYSSSLAYDPVNDVFVLQSGYDFYLYRFDTSGDLIAPTSVQNLQAR